MHNRPRAFGRAFLLGLALSAFAGQARAAEAINPTVSTAAESSRVLCSTPCFLRNGYVTTGAVAGFLMTFNATSAPADGAVTPRECIAVPAGVTVGLDFGEQSEPYPTGLTVVFSSTGCFTKTASATAFFKFRKQ